MASVYQTLARLGYAHDQRAPQFYKLTASFPIKRESLAMAAGAALTTVPIWRQTCLSTSRNYVETFSVILF